MQQNPSICIIDDDEVYSNYSAISGRNGFLLKAS